MSRVGVRQVLRANDALVRTAVTQLLADETSGVVEVAPKSARYHSGMVLPPLAALIRAAVDARSDENDVPAKGARRHGGVPLSDAFLTVYFLRPDGSIWEVDMEADQAVAIPVPAERHVLLLAAGAKRYPWLAELPPKVSAGATLCPACRGEGEIRLGPVRQIERRR
jgi:hypothetical protein